jgi:hypothetical protein
MTESYAREAGGRWRHLVRWRKWAGVGVAVATLTSALAFAATPVAAQAASNTCAVLHANNPSDITCAPCPTGVQWTSVGPNTLVPIYGTVGHPANPILKVDSATPTFLVAQSELVENATSTAITGTFTTSTSMTFTLTFSTTSLNGSSVTESGLASSVSDTVGETIAESVTTLFGVSATTPVPPNSEVIGQYGTQAYNVTYELDDWIGFDTVIVNGLVAPQDCGISQSAAGSGVAPTALMGWRVNPPQPIP